MTSIQSRYVRADTAQVLTDLYRPITAGQRWAVASHGYNTNHLAWGPASGNHLPHVRALIEAGFVVITTDAGGTQNWGGPACQTELDAVYALGQSMGLATKCELLASSMGGLGALTWLKNNAAKVRSALLFAPTSDLDAAHADATYTASIDAIYPTYATDSVNYDPIDNVASFVGLGVPVRIYHDTADTEVPIQWSRDFVAAAGSGYELIETGGDHTTLYDYVPPTEAARWVLSK